MKILLIAGHGAGDPGACACGYKEADLTREVATTLQAKLKTYADVVWNMWKNFVETGEWYNHIWHVLMFQEWLMKEKKYK